ncbi:MAG: hypothetical protein J6Q79_06810 [Clostridia bacterium]|nr:hypothetical protein [Clostridia bacterium]
MSELLNSISSLAGGASASAILKILTSNLENMNLETLFNTFLAAWQSFLEILFGMIGQ